MSPNERENATYNRKLIVGVVVVVGIVLAVALALVCGHDYVVKTGQSTSADSAQTPSSDESPSGGHLLSSASQVPFYQDNMLVGKWSTYQHGILGIPDKNPHELRIVEYKPDGTAVSNDITVVNRQPSFSLSEIHWWWSQKGNILAIQDADASEKAGASMGQALVKSVIRFSNDGQSFVDTPEDPDNNYGQPGSSNYMGAPQTYYRIRDDEYRRSLSN